MWDKVQATRTRAHVICQIRNSFSVLHILLTLFFKPPLESWFTPTVLPPSITMQIPKSSVTSQPTQNQVQLISGAGRTFSYVRPRPTLSWCLRSYLGHESNTMDESDEDPFSTTFIGELETRGFIPAEYCRQLGRSSQPSNCDGRYLSI
jgi:hypothetical protein